MLKAQPSIPKGGSKTQMLHPNEISSLNPERDPDLFETVTEEEIIFLWRSFKGRGLSEDQAWQAVVTGMALDMAFAKSRCYAQTEH
ncbi:MAG TPA: hypothetical protein VFQ89_02140 [Candidatus Binatia bacterium]|nr:hypothetical protein [Candidatus Binatia bacterium]